MPRIRSIKPDLWNDEALGGCSPLAILLFFGLITQADDEGRLRAHPARIKSAVLPFREDVTIKAVGAALEELHAAGVAVLYSIGGERYAALPAWKRHQRIDRPTKSDLPAPPDSTEPRVLSVEPSPQPRQAFAPEGKGEEGKGADRKKASAPDPEFDTFYASCPRKSKRPDALKAWKQTEKDRPPFAVLMAALRAKVEAASRRGDPNWLHFFPYPASLLRAHFWNDDVLVQKSHAHGFYTAPVPALFAAEPAKQPEPEPDPIPESADDIERESWIETFTSHGLPQAAEEAATCSMERLHELQELHKPHIERVRAAALAKIRAGRLVA
jgi:hypothetical protein